MLCWRLTNTGIEAGFILQPFFNHFLNNNKIARIRFQLKWGLNSICRHAMILCPGDSVENLLTDLLQRNYKSIKLHESLSGTIFVLTVIGLLPLFSILGQCALVVHWQAWAEWSMVVLQWEEDTQMLLCPTFSMFMIGVYFWQFSDCEILAVTLEKMCVILICHDIDIHLSLYLEYHFLVLLIVCCLN